MYTKLPSNRYAHTLKFLQSVLPAPAKILDLGVRNPFSEIMEENGYTVINTEGEDLDLLPETVKKHNVDAVTAFEIFEHLIAPFNVLKEIESTKLIATIPLNLWFAKAYRSKTDKWDRHYHEFEDWQFDWLLEKSNWEIKKSEKWTSPINKIGFRPILRKFIPRYYAVYAERPTITNGMMSFEKDKVLETIENETFKKSRISKLWDGKSTDKITKKL